MGEKGTHVPPLVVGTQMTLDERLRRENSSRGIFDDEGSGAKSVLGAFKSSKESRTSDALKIKDEQLKVLSEQNSKLLKTLDQLEDQANLLQKEKFNLEQLNRKLRDENFEYQTRTRAAEGNMKRSEVAIEEKERQIKLMNDQNSELLRLLEIEEAEVKKLNSETKRLEDENEIIKNKYNGLLTTAKTHEEMSIRAGREGQLRAEELRLLRAEMEHLRQTNSEIKLKTQVELESVHEQLRVRKEKQYQLLEKLQAAEEAKRQAEDLASGLEEKLRQTQSAKVELETKLQIEERAKRAQQDANKELTVEGDNLCSTNKELSKRLELSEQERLRMEAEARDSGEQLREMAEKVFQLLERLKMAEHGKTKTIEALKRKEQELENANKKNSRLAKEMGNEAKARVKAELDKKALSDQIKTLKKHNDQITARCREEVKIRLKESEEKKNALEKIRTLSSRLQFLLNKMQTDEEAKVVQKEEMRKMSAQIKTLSERNAELQDKLNVTGQSNRIITQAMKAKEEELDELRVKHEMLHKNVAQGGLRPESRQREDDDDDEGRNTESKYADSEKIKLNNGRGRFYTDVKPSQGVITLRSKHSRGKDFLSQLDINKFLIKAQKSVDFKQIVIERLGQILALFMIEREEKEEKEGQLENLQDHIHHLMAKSAYLEKKTATEEEAKRKIILRYINLVKNAATVMDDNGFGGGELQLSESGVTDEEVHAITALLKGNSTITSLSLSKNEITDDGARALASVLSTSTRLRSIDLRGNFIGNNGLKAIAEALERNEQVRHVYVHAGGKVEALGAGKAFGSSNAKNKSSSNGDIGSGHENLDHTAAKNANSGDAVSVSTICVVDIRENDPANAPSTYLDDLPSTLAPSFPSSSLVRRSKSENYDSDRSKGSGKKAGKKESKERLAKRREKLRAKQLKLEKEREIQRKLEAEANWNGRAGGLDKGKAPSANRAKNSHSSGEHTTNSSSSDRALRKQKSRLIGSEENLRSNNSWEDVNAEENGDGQQCIVESAEHSLHRYNSREDLPPLRRLSRQSSRENSRSRDTTSRALLSSAERRRSKNKSEVANKLESSPLMMSPGMTKSNLRRRRSSSASGSRG